VLKELLSGKGKGAEKLKIGVNLFQGRQ